jgi:hypothetical protein
MRRHPWYAEVFLSSPPMTPRAVQGLELALSLFDEVGLPVQERMQIVATVHTTVVSAALNAALEDRARERMGLTDEEIQSSFQPYAARIVASGRYPRVTEFFLGHAEQLGGEEDYLGAIDLILDGAEVRVNRIRAR